MSPTRGLAAAIACVWLAGCDQLGNPPQFATGPTVWKYTHGQIVTTTRSFRDEHTIRRLTAEGMQDLDYAEPSIGPSQTLTLVFVVPRRRVPTRRPEVKLVTVFKIAGRDPIVRRWKAPASSRRWSAGFALPAPPDGAVTSLEP